MAATTEEVPRPYGRGTSSVVSFVVAMNRVDVVELVVDLVDVDLDVGLVDVDLDALTLLTLTLTLTLLTLTLLTLTLLTLTLTLILFVDVALRAASILKSSFCALFSFFQVAKLGDLLGF